MVQGLEFRVQGLGLGFRVKRTVFLLYGLGPRALNVRRDAKGLGWLHQRGNIIVNMWRWCDPRPCASPTGG
jgi:hypothetical protein